MSATDPESPCQRHPCSDGIRDITIHLLSSTKLPSLRESPSSPPPSTSREKASDYTWERQFTRALAATRGELQSSRVRKLAFYFPLNVYDVPAIRVTCPLSAWRLSTLAAIPKVPADGRLRLQKEFSARMKNGVGTRRASQCRPFFQRL